jgi:hypothetical protein
VLGSDEIHALCFPPLTPLRPSPMVADPRGCPRLRASAVRRPAGGMASAGQRCAANPRPAARCRRRSRCRVRIRLFGGQKCHLSTAPNSFSSKRFVRNSTNQTDAPGEFRPERFRDCGSTACSDQFWLKSLRYHAQPGVLSYYVGGVILVIFDPSIPIPPISPC